LGVEVPTMRRVGFAVAGFALVSAVVSASACSAADTSSAFQDDGSGSGGSGAGAGGATTTATGQGGATTSTGVTTSTSGAGGATTTSTATSSGGAGTGGSGGATTTSSTASDAGPPKGDGGPGNCAQGTELVYVFTQDNEIYSFDPPNKKFTKIATPDCQAGGSPNSMAIDRNLVAWINYIGDIYEFDLKKKSGCVPSGVNLPFGFEQVGMGFSTDQPGGNTETLFIDSIGGNGLAKIANGAVSPIGSFANDANLAGQNAELTGTGAAKLFGYFTTFPNVRVAEIDKTNANILSDHELPGVSPPSAWAFSFWGGDFYLYAAPGNNASGNSSVIKYDAVAQTVDAAYVADTGFTIVGAGVSTCAPILHQ
jgi:hypothetical protein